MSRAGMAALARHQQPPQRQPQKQPERPAARPPVPSAAALQGGLSEDEALRRALEASMRDQGPSGAASGMSQEEQDRMLAEAIARSEREAATGHQQPATGSESKNCQIS